MSNSPSSPENAAIAVPVSTGRPADDAVAAASTAMPAHRNPNPSPNHGSPPPPPPPAPQPQPPQEVPPSVPSVPPTHQGIPSQTSHTTTVPPHPPAAASVPHHADQIKYSRGPAVLQRPQGPSLLTQQLSTARGIPSSPQKEPSHSSSTTPTSQHPPSHSIPESQSHQLPIRSVAGPHSNNDPHEDSDDGSMTPRGPGSPPTSTMAAVSTAVSLAPGSHENPHTAPYNMLDLGEVNSMLSGHRDFLHMSKGRVASLERIGSESKAPERPVRANTFAHHSTGSSVLVTPHFTESPSGLLDGSTDGIATPETAPLPPARPWKTEHRVSVGPEKAWSIGTGELADDQDGQVEKSITEVLAGVEPNARSRKASHSLRFFKEGLPEEKGKKKEPRQASQLREKLSPTVELPEEVERPKVDNERRKSLPAPTDKSVATERAVKPIPITGRTPEAQPIQQPEDYFSHKTVQESNREPAPERKLEGQDHGENQSGRLTPESGRDPRRKSNGSIEGRESADDGEDSGEEKISSAVFVPHKDPEEAQERPPVPGVPPRSVPPSRALSRSEDFHPWLVKAGEPEEDHQEEEIPERESDLRPESSATKHFVGSEVDYNRVDDSAIADERESGLVQAKPSRTISEYHNEEESVHEAPKQPLEAIELIPYKHQVGGHTTIWRFSRRAVCKQLNNRENEFYEKIEKYHRDLLAFLPRYIGVLNVTFQKQPRRKSVLKRDDASGRQSEQAKTDATSKDGSQQPAVNDVEQSRVISQSLQSTQVQIPTVTFVDNQHILPRSLLQPTQNGIGLPGRFRSASASLQSTRSNENSASTPPTRAASLRPSLEDRHANSWGATTVNKRLRNEVFNDAFLKQPIAVHRHKKGYQRSLPRRSLQLRPTGSDPNLMISSQDRQPRPSSACGNQTESAVCHSLSQSKSDIGHPRRYSDDMELDPKDVTGTSAPEPEIIGDSSPAQKRKRRYSGTGLRRKPNDVRDSRGDLKYFEEADDANYKGVRRNCVSEDLDVQARQQQSFPAPASDVHHHNHDDKVEDESRALSTIPGSSAAPSEPESPTSEFKKIPRPINPKEAQTQRDSRVEYFLLLEDLTAGMKRPCIMDLKMGTRQYGVDANPKKQKSQQGKCAKTTSRELGVRVCGLQVWDVKTQSYVFKDKYYGRDLKKGDEFQGALTRFLYDGVDKASILRHIPTVLHKLSELELIISRLNGYRFYAASLLMFYDGDTTAEENGAGHMSMVEDSTTDFATDTEESAAMREVRMKKKRRDKREIDFKMADFANCVTAGDIDSLKDRPCPPAHPSEPDRGFLRGLRSLRRYFLRIQRDVRAEMQVGAGQQQRSDREYYGLDLEDDDYFDEGGDVSE